MLSDKGKPSEEIKLVDGEKTIGQYANNSDIVNTIFPNSVKNLKNSESEEVNAFAGKTSHSVMNAMLKYSKHPSIVGINVTNMSTFPFS